MIENNVVARVGQGMIPLGKGSNEGPKMSPEPDSAIADPQAAGELVLALAATRAYLLGVRYLEELYERAHRAAQSYKR
jgi:hypothetical protein